MCSCTISTFANISPCKIACFHYEPYASMSTMSVDMKTLVSNCSSSLQHIVYLDMLLAFYGLCTCELFKD